LIAAHEFNVITGFCLFTFVWQLTKRTIRFMQLFLFVLLLSIAVIVIIKMKKKKQHLAESLIPVDEMDSQLAQHVVFYQQLTTSEKEMFRQRAQHFLDTTIITPVKEVIITHLDKLYVASSAIIPIFHFKDWAYNNLDEVLIYPGTFTKDFDIEDEERNVLGMVGDGAMHRMMILSLPSLRAGFEAGRASNTGIHEFVHLLDKADGATDGVPEYLIPKDLVRPWIRFMHQEIHSIRNGESDLNPYAGTNEAEFFAVISEYFFQKPAFLQEHHPELYNILVKTYGTNEPIGS
jgi:Mlc titration factor MtfA (ptsG expression regulator)